MKKHILLIDDDKDELDILNDAINEIPVPLKCTWAQSSDHALKMIPYLDPDVILVDLNMPKTDGLACLREIKKLEKALDIPVVLYSTHIDDNSRVKAKALGAAMCVQKPGDIDSLTALIEDVLQLQLK